MIAGIRGYAARSWAALREVGGNRGIRLVVTAFIVFGASRWALQIALLVYAYQAAGPFGIAVLGIVQMLPSVVLVPLVSGLGDRFGRHRVLTVTDSVGAVSALVLGYTLYAGLDIVIVYLLAALVATSVALVRPIQAALLPALARSPGELVASNVVTSTAEALGALVGPALGAAILVAGGPALVALVAAAGMAVAALAVARVHVAPTARPLAEAAWTGMSGFLTLALEGLRALARLPGPRLLSTGFVAQVTVRGMLTVLLVVLAVSTMGLGAPGVGTLNAAIGAGGLIGAGLAMGLVGRRRLGPAWALALVGWGLPILLIGLVPQPLVAIVLLAILGVSNAVLDVAGFTLLQGIVPDRVRAGVLGALEGLLGLGVALGGILGSVLVERTDVQTALIVAGAILPLLALVLWRSVSRLDDHLIVPEAQLQLLRGVPMFAPLSLAVVERLAAGLAETEYAAGSDIISQGDPGDAFYLLVDGSTEVLKDGRHQAILGPGTSFGEIALIQGIPRTATVRATTNVTVYRLACSDFLSAVTGNAYSSSAAERVIAERSAQAEA